MKKSGKLLAVVCLAVIVIACFYFVFVKGSKTTINVGADSTDNVKVTPTPVIDTQATGNKETETTVSVGIEPTEPQASMDLIRITREEAGLDTIPGMDFSGFSLNERIHELLIEKRAYSDNDMKAGIIAPFLITERFREPVIGNISIGTSMNDAEALLGTPSYRQENIIIYKTDDYYIAISGNESVELVNFAQRPQAYDIDILNQILTGCCLEDIYLTDLLDRNSKIADFFERTGFINGGGHYALSDSGVRVDTLSVNIKIYNNFEGHLYKTDKDTEYKIEYINTDSVMEDMMWDFNEYSLTNKDFIERGKISPSGKYMAKYDYVYSMSHYFTIRTMDYSKPDFMINALALEFEWINDDYIIYTGTFTTLPAVTRVTQGNMEHIRLFSGVDDLEYDYGFGKYSFSIKEITKDRFVLEDKNADASKGEKVIWEIPYVIDENGEFILPEQLQGL